MRRTFVIADIHGAYDAMCQVFERSGFDYDADRLICLGDVCDRGNGVKACVEELLQVRQLVMIMGNHDQWALEWMLRVKEANKKTDAHAVYEIPDSMLLQPDMSLQPDDKPWIQQGGTDTIESYKNGLPVAHIDFFNKAGYYFVEENRLFVHGGIELHRPLEQQDKETFLWDRSLVEAAVNAENPDLKLTGFDAVYVGHTPTIRFLHQKNPDYPATGQNNAGSQGKSSQVSAGAAPVNQADAKLCAPQPAKSRSPVNKPVMGNQTKLRNDFPARICNIYMMDTGAAWPGGRLSMMDIHTCEVWQSDQLP